MADNATLTANIVDGVVVNADIVQGTTITAEIATGGRGETGPQGPVGPQGPTGPQGPPNLAIPPGGTIGQVLSKATSTDYDTRWASLGTYQVGDFGAKGDGITDDTAAIQLAINTIATAGGGTLVFPSGNFLISSALQIKSYLSLVGSSSAEANKGTSIIQSSTTANAIEGVITTTSISSVEIRNIRLQGPGTGSGNGVYLKNTGSGGSHPPFTYMSFRDLYIASFGGSGFKAESLIASVFERVICESNAYGFFFEGDAGGTGYSTVNTSISMSACYANGNTTRGFSFSQSTYVALNACAADSNGTGYYFNKCNAISLVACGSEYGAVDAASPGNSFVIDNISQQIGLYNCYTLQSKNISVWVTGNSFGVTLVGFQENSPLIGAVNSFKVDANCIATEIDSGTSKPRSIAGTFTSLTDGGGGISIPATGYFGGAVSLPTIRDWNGWQDANETWTYASATTITVPSGATSRYQVGDKIKLIQSATTKYFYIVGVTSTVLTITGGTSYTLTNNTITGNYYSKLNNPQDFPQWFAFTPAVTAGSGTFTSVASVARFTITGRTCTYISQTTTTTVGTAATETRLTFPVPPSASAIVESTNGVGQEIFNTGSMLQGRVATTTRLSIRDYTNAFCGTTGAIQNMTISYEI